MCMGFSNIQCVEPSNFLPAPHPSAGAREAEALDVQQLGRFLAFSKLSDYGLFTE